MSNKLVQILEKPMTRRTAVATVAAGVAATSAVAGSSLNPLATQEAREKALLEWKQFFQGHYRLMTEQEKAGAVERLERRYELETGRSIDVSSTAARPGVLYGYAFNVSKCRGYGECVKACVAENNQDRSTHMAYIRIHEHTNGQLDFSESTDEFAHEVPAAGHFYIGTQCMQCDNPPCVDVCPVKATWKEPDGIVVVDYNWCIGCRYCMAACPYDARRFNWSAPQVPEAELNPNQHYLGNRLRNKGVVEKCTFCIQRSREGKNPACVEACPTGARVFGNLLDPNGEIRWILANKKVFRLKEDLGTDPKFWYYMD